MRIPVCKVTYLRAVILVTLFACLASGQGVLQTVLGTDKVFPRDPIPATEAPFGILGKMSVDPAGRICVADILNNVVLLVNENRQLSVIAGNGIRGFSGDGGPALNASLAGPVACVFERGDLIIADTGNNRVRRVASDGTITTIAGNGEIVGSGDAGSALRTALDTPIGLAVSSNGILYISEPNKNRIRLVMGNGEIRSLSSNFSFPEGLAIGKDGLLYIAEAGAHRIRRVRSDGGVETVAGNGVAAFAGDGGPALAASLNQPKGIVFDSDGNLIIADALNNRVRIIDRSGTIRTLAGNGDDTISGDGGRATAAGILGPASVGVDASGNIYSTDGNNKIRRIQPIGLITTYAGSFYDGSTGDGGDPLSAELSFPNNISLDVEGNLFVSGANRIRKLTADGDLSTIAGTGVLGFSGDGALATEATLTAPWDAVKDQKGNLIIADTYNNRIRKVSPDGVIRTIAGDGKNSFSGDNGPATSASIGLPLSMAIDSSGNLYVAQLAGNRIRKISPDGVISTVAGNGRTTAAGDGGPALQASIGLTYGIVLDSLGNLYAADVLNHVIRKVTPQGIITTVAGNGTSGFSGDGGQATRASLNSPHAVAFTPSGEMLISDYENHRIRLVDKNGIISTIAGTGERGEAQEGTSASEAALTTPYGITVAPNGDIYFAENLSHKIKVIRNVRPSIGVSAEEITMTLESGGASTTATVAVSTTIAGTPFTARVTSDDGLPVDWIELSPPQGRLPSDLTLRFLPSALAVGVHTATLEISVPNASSPFIQVPITLDVSAKTSQGTVNIAPGLLSFQADEGGESRKELLVVLNRGGAGPLSYMADGDKPWLRVQPKSGIALPDQPGNLVIVADPSGLAPGQYSGQVTVMGGDQKPVSVPVALVVARPVATLRLSQSGLSFQVVEGGGDVSQKFAVLNSGTGSMPWTLQTATDTGGNWLSVSPASGTTDATSISIPEVTVQINAAGLKAGRYLGRVNVVANGAANSPQSVQIDLTVLPAGSTPRAILLQTGLVFGARSEVGSPGAQQVQVLNLLPSPLAFNSTRGTFDGGSWFVHTPSAGTIGARGTSSLIVQPSITGLTPGIYDGAITMIFRDFEPRTVRVLLALAPQSLPSQSVNRVAEAQTCIPFQLRALFTNLADGFSATVGSPVSIEARVIDDCGVPLVNGRVVLTTPNGEDAVPLVSLKDGRWTGTWTPRSPGSNVELSAYAFGFDTELVAKAQILGQATNSQ